MAEADEPDTSADGSNDQQYVVVVAHMMQFSGPEIRGAEDFASRTLTALEARLTQLGFEVVPYSRYQGELTRIAPRCLGAELARSDVVEPEGPSMLYFLGGPGDKCIRSIHKAARDSGASSLVISGAHFLPCEMLPAKPCLQGLDVYVVDVDPRMKRFEQDWGLHIRDHDILNDLSIEELEPEAQYSVVLEYLVQLHEPTLTPSRRH